MIIPDDAQGLLRARATPAPGKLLSTHTTDGPYGDRFWAQVALGVQKRTAGECLDAYLAIHGSPVARFSVSDTCLPVATTAANLSLRRRASLSQNAC